MKSSLKVATVAAAFAFGWPAFAQTSGSGTGTGATGTSGTDAGVSETVPGAYDSTTTKKKPARSAHTDDRSGTTGSTYDSGTNTGSDSARENKDRLAE